MASEEIVSQNIMDCLIKENADLMNHLYRVQNDLQSCLDTIADKDEELSLLTEIMEMNNQNKIKCDTRLTHYAVQVKSYDYTDILVEKINHVESILTSLHFHQCVIFCNESKGVEVLCRIIKRINLPVVSILKVDPENCISEMEKVKNRSRVFVTNRLAVPNINFHAVNLIINFDLPRTSTVYLYRVSISYRCGHYSSDSSNPLKRKFDSYGLDIWNSDRSSCDGKASFKNKFEAFSLTSGASVISLITDEEFVKMKKIEKDVSFKTFKLEAPFSPNLISCPVEDEFIITEKEIEPATLMESLAIEEEKYIRSSANNEDDPKKILKDIKKNITATKESLTNSLHALNAKEK